MERLQALVQQRQQEGADVQPVGELMQGLPPLMEQQKFAEAEALLDRALELANKLGSPAQTGVPPAPTGPPPALQRKMQCLEKQVQKWQQQGKDPQPIGEMMQDFQPLVEQQKFTEAERVIDRALKLAGGACPDQPATAPGAMAPQTGLPPSLQRKMQCLQAQIQKWQQEGKDLQPIGEMMQDFQPLVEQQKFAEAERVIDRALKLAGGACPDQPATAPGAMAPQTGLPPSLQRKMQCLQAQIQKWQQEGKDLQPIGEIMQDFPPLVEQQKFTEAERVIDRALKLAGAACPDQPTSPPGASSSTQAGPPPSLQRKMQCLQAQIQTWQQEGKDPRPIGEIMQEIPPLVKKQKFAEAERVVDRALKLTGEACPSLSGPQLWAEEQQAYAAIQAQGSAGLDADKIISLTQDFEKKFPNSTLLSYVYAFEASGYQQKGEINKLVEASEKSLKLNPDNLMSLIAISSMLPQPRLMQGSDLDKEKKLTEAETDANHALDLIGKLPKQPNETDDQFKKRKDNISSEPHAALGMVHLQKARMALTGGMDPDELAKAAQDFKASVDLTDRPAPQNYFRLGEIYTHQNKIDDAIRAFSKASELGQGTGIQQFADSQIEALKKRQAQAKPPGAN
jgi:tetratricopeptide (TPR) repeat protein